VEEERGRAPAVSGLPAPEAAPRPKGLSKMEQRRRQQRLTALEEEITTLENQLAGLSRQLENPPNDPGRVQELGQEYLRVQHDLEARLGAWEQLSEEIS
jgi:ATP-binding cassette subfamily F protein 3